MKDTFLNWLKIEGMSPIKILTITWIVSLLLLPLVGSIIWSTYDSYTKIAKQEFELQVLVGDIGRLNEVLTTSARMAAMSGDLKWEDQYGKYERELDSAIVRAALKARESYEESYAASIKAAYTQLIEMEGLVFALAGRGRLKDAKAIIFGDDYATQKKLYSEGITKLTGAIQAGIEKNLRNLRQRMLTVGALGVVVVLALLLVWLGVVLVVRMQLRERKRAEDALRASEQKFRTLVENAPLGIFLCDSQGTVKDVNPMITRVLPVGNAQSLHNSDVHKSPAFVQTGITEQIAACIQTGDAGATEHPYSNNGDRLHIRLHLTPFVAPDGSIEGVQGLVEDISERKNAELDLNRAHEMVSAEAQKLRVLIEGMEEGVVFVTENNEITEANSWFLDKVGYSRDNVIGKTLKDCGLDNKLEEILIGTAIQYEKGSMRTPLVVNRRFKETRASIRVQPRFHDDRYVGMIINIIDVGDLIQARERAEQADRSKSELHRDHR